MQYIIDGCNFIKKFGGGSPRDFEGEKRRFISRLERYASGRHVKVSVVFDSSIPSYKKYGKLTVIHAEDADEKIISEVGKIKSPAGARVVSDDRAVKKAAAGGGAGVLGVDEFEFFLAKKLDEGGKPFGRPEKPSPDRMTEYDIREWEEYFKR